MVEASSSEFVCPFDFAIGEVLGPIPSSCLCSPLISIWFALSTFVSAIRKAVTFQAIFLVDWFSSA